MELTSDIYIKYSGWEKVMDLFPSEQNRNPKINAFRRLIDLFIVACTIGISSDEYIENDLDDTILTIGRNTMGDVANEDINNIMSFLLKMALLTTSRFNNESMDTREKLAFDEKYNINNYSAANILLSYANYGVDEISKVITSHDTETLFNIIELINNKMVSGWSLPDVSEFDDFNIIITK